MVSAERTSENQRHAVAEAIDDIRRIVPSHFQIGEVLNQTPTSIRCVGVDTQNQQPIVLRLTLLESMPAERRMRIEHETVLSLSLRSEWLSPILFTGRERHWHVVVREFVPGVPLSERLSRGPLGECDAHILGVGMFSALADLHRCGVLHRHVDPPNVIVNGQGPITTVKLVDFGPQAADIDSTEMSPRALQRARYMAPEQSGLIDQDVTEASDLYSAGALLFHCLCGHPPFPSETPQCLALGAHDFSCSSFAGFVKR